MCGIAGIYRQQGKTVDQNILVQMAQAMVHRGPDGEGFFCEGEVGLAHRRLSIIDLEGGAQPLFSDDNNIVLVANGEIYNYKSLRQELEGLGARFSTHSDCEVLIYLYKHFGLDGIHKVRGMFAFALFDKLRKKILLFRDRFGIKPLYYCVKNSELYFASEIKPLLRAGISVELNKKALPLYLQSRFAHSDETLFKNVFRLPEGHCLEFDGKSFKLHNYYPNPVPHGGAFVGADPEQAFASQLQDSLSTELVSDVPVGVFLSGGIDSSLAAYMMRQNTQGPIHSFSVSFSKGFSEGELAAEFSKELGTTHHNIVCTAEDLLRLPQVIRSLEEPVGDAIVIAMDRLAHLTHENGIKTVITGDGADEILGGYQYFSAAFRAISWTQKVSSFLPQSVLQNLVAFMPLILLEKLGDMPFDVARESRNRLATLVGLAHKKDVSGIYNLLLSLCLPGEIKELLVPGFVSWQDYEFESFGGPPQGHSLLDQILSQPYRKWLPTNINLKQDKICMAHSVENRVPFLDVKLVELCLSLPNNMKIRSGKTKWALRNQAKKWQLDALSRRKKIPFHYPVHEFLGEPKIKPFIEECRRSLIHRRNDVFHPESVNALFKQGFGGDFISAKKLVSLVAIELWFRAFMDGESF